MKAIKYLFLLLLCGSIFAGGSGISTGVVSTNVGFKNQYVQIPIPLADASNNLLLTVNQSLVGAINELAIGGSGMLNPMTAKGDIIYGGTSGVPTALHKGDDGKVLTLSDGVPSWQTGGSVGALLLNQSTPQTFSAGDVTGTGLLKVTSGTLGLDSTSYLNASGSVTGATTYSQNFTNGITTQNTIASNIDNITTTTVNGLLMTTPTASTASVGTQVRNAPAMTMIGHMWNTTTGQDNTATFKQELRPSYGATPSSTLYWGFDLNGAGFADRMSLNSTGTLALLNSGMSAGATIGMTRSGNTAVSYDGLTTATGAATSGVTERWSPRLRLSGAAWNTTPFAANNYINFTQEVVTTSGATPSGILSFKYDRNNGGYSELARLYSTGNLTLSGQASKVFGMERMTTASTAGQAFSINAGGAVSGGTDLDGGMLTLSPGISTGTGKASVRIQRLKRSSASGSTDNGLIDGIIVPSTKNLDDGSAVPLFDITLENNSATGGWVQYVVECNDNINFQVHSGVVYYSAVNKGGTYTTNIANTLGSSVLTSGTLSGSWTLESGSSKVTVKANYDSSLSTKLFKIRYVIHNGSDSSITQL